MLHRLAACAVIAAAVLWTFAPVRDFAFLNWDDEAVVVRNAALEGPDILRWAFTTTYMEHYQPVSWLVLAAIKRTAGLDPASFHTANLAAHVICALLVLSVTAALVRRAAPAMAAGRRGSIALIAALLYALHPLRVEVVAWVSALPYSLALALALASVLCWLRAGGDPPRNWWIAAFLLFVVSLAARPIALGLPIVLVALDRVALERPLRESLGRVWPFALVAVGWAAVEGFARAPGVNDTPWLYRLQSAALAPLVYLWHTVAPLRLTPLDLLPGRPVANPLIIAAALLALAVASMASWWWRRRWPWLAASVLAYAALLAPAAGLIPSGLQATADRYSYVPGVVLAIAVTAAAASWAGSPAWRRRPRGRR
jgi:protein O-mannosyl-transferase